MAPAARGRRDTGGRQLARAGWSVLSSSSLPGLPKPQQAAGQAPLQESDGARLVGEVATSWGRRFMHTIKYGGYHDGAYHYECLFSRPLSETPVPGMVVAVRFALMQDKGWPRLFYSFEEGDLRLEWALQQDEHGVWRAGKGQQFLSLKHGVFEKYLDSRVNEKEATKQRGINLCTAFEETRLKPPASVDVEVAVAARPSDARVDSEDIPEESRSDLHSCCATILLNNSTQLADTSRGDVQDTSEEAMVTAMWDALIASGLAWAQVARPASLTELLGNIFDAADEENTGQLPHYEMARVLGSTLPGFGLEEWDIHLLIAACAQESDDGFVDSQSFIDSAPKTMVELRTRRLAYKARGMPGVEIKIDAVRHCFGEEIVATAELLRKAFEERCADDPTSGIFAVVDLPPGSKEPPRGEDPTLSRTMTGMSSQVLSPIANSESLRGSKMPTTVHEELVGMRRRDCRECLRQMHERLSPQEVKKIMEILPEDEDGNLHFVDLVERLEYLRTEAISNGVIETDVPALRKLLVNRLRSIELDEDNPGKMKVWDIKNALLTAEQVCFSRLQIHVLLCLAEPDADTGDVNVNNFLGTCCVVIPHMCDAKIFMATAERLILEHEENKRRKENAELAALQQAKVASATQDGEEKSQENDVDQETVERTLIQVLQFHDSTHRQVPALPPADIFEALFSNDTQVESCQLSDFELTGLVAELTPNADGEVPYVEHIKRWVPMLFEIRKSPLLDAYLKEDAASSLGIPHPNVAELEAIMPLVPQELIERAASKSASFAGDAEAGASSKTPMGRSRAGSKVMSQQDGEQVEKSASKLISFRRSGGSRAGSKAGSSFERQRSSSKSSSVLNLEPPPGRGFERRKMLLHKQMEKQMERQMDRRELSPSKSPPAPGLERTTSSRTGEARKQGASLEVPNA